MVSEPKSKVNLTVYRGHTSPGVYIWSPFVSKLEARLRFGGVSYHTEAGSLSKAPKGKIPYATYDPKESDTKTTPPSPLVLPDSTFIIRKLVDDGVLEDINAKLSPTEKAHDLALRALLEDKLYFTQNYERWLENYPTMRSYILSALPYPMQAIIGWIIYRGIARTLRGQGTGRFSSEEIASIRREVWENINSLLVESRSKKNADDDSMFWVLGGTGPSEADAVLYGFIASSLVCDGGPDTMKLVRSYPVVMDYARRIHDRYFPDYACWD